MKTMGMENGLTFLKPCEPPKSLMADRRSSLGSVVGKSLNRTSFFTADFTTRCSAEALGNSPITRGGGGGGGGAKRSVAAPLDE